ncbi:MAG: nucleotidyltransferase domain-containing protein [Nitrososphaeria archaeon]|nr:nucleotidyltransferase domain-containing protein [Nitrososphaeria archaeon]
MDYLKRHMKIAYEVKKIIKEIDSNAKVYVFGSTVRGKYTASSDIDMLVVTEKIEEKNRMAVEVYKHVEAPVELHIVTPEKFENWYKKFIKPEELVEIE